MMKVSIANDDSKIWVQGQEIKASGLPVHTFI